MSIEIRSIGGKVLYVAERASDVRQALEEAVNKGANLSGADLRSAYLRSAYLRSANLRSANLSGAYLSGADLSGADLRSAYLRSANLRSANLRSAYLRSADLSGADLSGAYLSGADLSGADLSGADLRSAKGIAPERVNDLLILLDQPGKIRAYKIVNAAGEGIYARLNGHAPITYRVGESYEVADANTDATRDCGPGINLATLPWCLREWREGYRVLVAEFTAKDIAAIPTAGDGKFRVCRCKIVRELEIDPVALGLAPAPSVGQGAVQA